VKQEKINRCRLCGKDGHIEQLGDEHYICCDSGIHYMAYMSGKPAAHELLSDAIAEWNQHNPQEEK